MKQVILYLTLIPGILTLLQSCKKENVFDTNQETINVTIKINEDYQYDLGTFGDEEGVIINQQAIHYAISTTERDLGNSKISYKYTPLADYVGTDEVELKSERGSDGASPNNEIKFTTIKFTIIE